MDTSVVSVNPNIQGGTPCFRGTRVPISTLFDHLQQGYTLEEFLADFPTVTREQADALLEQSKRILERDALASAK
jgi:uncharacterized protein (DUF433 family)